MADPPYKVIWDQIVAGHVVPFLGAGASLTGTPAGEWNDQATMPPTGGQLTNWLGQQAGLTSESNDLPKVASYYEVTSGRAPLRESLSNVFRRKFALGAVHRFLASVPTPMLIITTNYDSLIEDAFREAGKEFHLVVYPNDRLDIAGQVLWWEPGSKKPTSHSPSTLNLSPRDAKASIIYKMHGSARPEFDQSRATPEDNFVITEEDYVAFLSLMMASSAVPAHFMAHCRNCHFLFLGYGLRDWNFRVMLETLKPARALKSAGSGSDRMSWAIQWEVTEVEEELWRRRQVGLYQMDVSTFVAGVEAKRP